MDVSRHSDCFKMNFLCWKVFGIWAGKSPSKYYKYYSFFYVFTFLIFYNSLLTVNLFYTPRKVEVIIEEVIYYFNELSIMMKVATIILWRTEILSVFEILDCEAFEGNNEIGRNIVSKAVQKYKTCWKAYAILCHFTFFLGSLLPIILNFTLAGYEIALPVSNYHIFNNETKNHYFGYLYLYQDIGLYSQMMYNVNIDSFFAGLLFFAIIQMKVLDHELRSLEWNKNSSDTNARKQIYELNYCLRHYEAILKYCEGIQGVLSVALFVQYGMASAIICVIFCAILLPDAKVASMLSYSVCMTVQIFVPAWLGTQLTYQSQKLVLAAYSSEWVPRSEAFKSSVKLFMERANTPIIITGMNLFILNLENFIAIMKTAYSFLTLVRNIQEDN